jgi:hypothetical protein
MYVMQLDSLAFAGYRSFAARSPAFPDRPLKKVRLAPLTILLGKNNSGKSTVARLFHHVLTGLGSDGNDPFPMAGPLGSYGRSFRDIQHGGSFFNPVDLEIDFASKDGTREKLVAQVIQTGDLAGDSPPVLQKSILNGQGNTDSGRVRGLMPDIEAAESLRLEARELLDASCYLGPLRPLIKPSYPVQSSDARALPDTDDSVAQTLYRDAELRAAIGSWTAQNLDGWRVDVRQNLDVFQIISRRPGREINIGDSGQGLQQVLPIAVLCCSRKLGRGQQNFLDVIEQPELHLHDAAHAPVGDLLLSAVAEARGRILVETHSESLVLRVRRRVAEGLSPDQVSIVFVEDLGDRSVIRNVRLDQNGDVDWWPDGVFSEAFVEVKAIRRAQHRRTLG